MYFEDLPRGPWGFLIRKFKSVRKARIRLGRVTVLLGPPLAGKSNILQ
jgi:predicted ATPase